MTVDFFCVDSVDNSLLYMMRNMLFSVLRFLLKICSSWHMNKINLLPLHFLDLVFLLVLPASCCSDVADADLLQPASNTLHFFTSFSHMILYNLLHRAMPKSPYLYCISDVSVAALAARSSGAGSVGAVPRRGRIAAGPARCRSAQRCPPLAR